MAEEQATSLLQLPDPCLLAVLQTLADDPVSLCSAARAHSRLHQAAVVALSSISGQVNTQQQMDSSLMPYLSKYGQHVGSICLWGDAGKGGSRTAPDSLLQLPPNLQLTSLQFNRLRLHLQPGDGCPGVLGPPGLPLKRLQLLSCMLRDGADALAAALSLLPGLEHLEVSNMLYSRDAIFCFPTEALQQLPQLTYLKIAVYLSSRATSNPLQSLQSLTRLAGLELASPRVVYGGVNTPGSCFLTRLVLTCAVGPGAFAGNTQLQHVVLSKCSIAGGAAAVLSELQQLQQLTHLSMAGSWWGVRPAAAAFSALTASSKLHHLDISRCTLPTGAWEHMFTAGRQLPHMQTLLISVRHPSDFFAAAPDGSRLASCCPGLRSLGMHELQCSAELLHPLTRLSSLQALSVSLPREEASQDELLGRLSQLTGLKQLVMRGLYSVALYHAGLLIQLTQLRQLTRLTCDSLIVMREAPGGEPVWRQLLQHHLDHKNPKVAQQAAASALSLIE